MLTTPSISITTEQDYGTALDLFGFKCTASRFFYHIGQVSKSQGWLLHISCISNRFNELFSAVAPILLVESKSFKVVRNYYIHIDFNNATYGVNKIGKIITVFLDDDGGDIDLLRKLKIATQGFLGPAVLTDLNVGGVLYIRYGSYENLCVTNEFGENLRVLVNDEGVQVPDVYFVPAQVPYWIKNPFSELMPPTKKREKRSIHGRYFPKSKMKSDLKGDVIKCAYFKNLIPSLCVLKQGRIGMYFDQYGRDMQDILLWQYRVGKELAGKIPIPEIIEEFVEHNTQCIVMEYIDGIKLTEEVYLLMQLKPWFTIDNSDKRKVFEYLLQIIASVKTLHENGYIHRDLTGYNFLVSEHKIFLIDLELIYSEEMHLPDPPFVKGTEGFMSPNQETLGHPEFGDDTYAFGALMVQVFFGGLDPGFIIERNTENLASKLLFTLHDQMLVDTILKCIEVQTEDRIQLSNVEQILQSKVIDENILKSTGIRLGTFERDDIARIIQHGINYIMAENMTVEKLWYSYVENNFDWETYPLGDRHVFSSMHRGVGGVIHTLFEAKKCGFDTAKAQEKISAGWQYIANQVFGGQLNSGGLHFGATGVGLLLCRCIERGNIKSTDISLNMITKCFSVSNSQLGLIQGVSGDGLAIIQSTNVLGSEPTLAALRQISSDLIDKQERDGSWKFNDGLKINGFGYGIAGVVYFLLEYGVRYDDMPSLRAAERGLNYLTKNAIKRPGYWEWTQNNKSKDRGFWWCHGGPGIALSYIKAYEIFQDRSYLDIAGQALRIHPKEIFFPNLSQCHGLSGLGEIYLEAFRVAKNDEWQERADWIAGFLCAHKFKPAADKAYWLVETAYNFPTADLMIGCSGVIHFLLRYLNSDKLYFPLLPEPL